MGISDMDKATEKDLAADIALRVEGAQAVRALRKRCLNQHELARLLGTTQAEISRVATTRARASRRVMRDAIRISALVTEAIEAAVSGAIEGRMESMKRQGHGALPDQGAASIKKMRYGATRYMPAIVSRVVGADGEPVRRTQTFRDQEFKTREQAEAFAQAIIDQPESQTAISHEQWRGINTGAHTGCDQPAPPFTLAAGSVVKP